MTKTAQDFSLYAGDDAAPEFTVQDASGAPINLQGADNILWKSWTVPDHATGPSKNKNDASPSGISFKTDGSDGVVIVTLSATDTENLSGVYEHFLMVVDSFGKEVTVTEGMMTVFSRPADA